jgi:hypothetical protein
LELCRVCPFSFTVIRERISGDCAGLPAQQRVEAGVGAPVSGGVDRQDLHRAGQNLVDPGEAVGGLAFQQQGKASGLAACVVQQGRAFLAQGLADHGDKAQNQQGPERAQP